MARHLFPAVLLAILALVPAARAQIAPASTAVRKPIPGDALSPNIIGGLTVNPPFRYPWVAAIVDTDYYPATNGLRCGGAIINTAPWIMLTAAHCTEDFFDGRGKGLSSLYPLMRVQAHRFDLEKPCAAENCIELRPVKATWHPFFSRPTQGSSRWVVWDFAVWLLQPVPSNYTRPAIKPPALDTGSGAGTITTMLGHGLTTVIPGIWDDGTMGPKLQGINVSLITPARCAALDGIPMSPSFQCSMPVNLKGGQCRGDSGAPVVKTLQETRCYRQLEPNTNNCVTTQRDILVGLNSFGARDCGTGSIIIGTGQAKIAAAKSWIETVVCNWGGKCLKRTTTRKLVRTTTRKIIRTTSR